MPSKQFIERCIELAVESVEQLNGGPFAALVSKDSKIIAEATNEVTKTNDPSAHAEIQAIRKACRKLNSFQLDGCDLYTSCEPCPMCLGAIYWARPNRVYFAATKHMAAEADFDDEFIYEEIDKKFSDRKIEFVQLLDKEVAQKPFLVWTNKADKILY